jgi:hypothetical protein
MMVINFNELLRLELLQAGDLLSAKMDQLFQCEVLESGKVNLNQSEHNPIDISVATRLVVQLIEYGFPIGEPRPKAISIWRFWTYLDECNQKDEILGRLRDLALAGCQPYKSNCALCLSTEDGSSVKGFDTVAEYDNCYILWNVAADSYRVVPRRHYLDINRAVRGDQKDIRKAITKVQQLLLKKNYDFVSKVCSSLNDCAHSFLEIRTGG